MCVCIYSMCVCTYLLSVYIYICVCVYVYKYIYVYEPIYVYVKVKFTQLCPFLCNPMDCSLPDSHPWNSSGQITGVGSYFLLQGIFSTQGFKPRSSTLLANSLLSEPPGKPVCIHIYVYVSINGEIVYGIFALETLLFQKNAKVIYMHIHTCKHKLKTRRGSLSSNLSSENFYWIYN